MPGYHIMPPTTEHFKTRQRVLLFSKEGGEGQSHIINLIHCAQQSKQHRTQHSRQKQTFIFFYNFQLVSLIFSPLSDEYQLSQLWLLLQLKIRKHLYFLLVLPSSSSSPFHFSSGFSLFKTFAFLLLEDACFGRAGKHLVRSASLLTFNMPVQPLECWQSTSSFAI